MIYEEKFFRFMITHINIYTYEIVIKVLVFKRVVTVLGMRMHVRVSKY